MNEMTDERGSQEKPTCQLTGKDGNAFTVIGNVSKTLKEHDMQEQSIEFRTRAMQCESYDELLQLCFEYVEVQ